jgi:hypothetical protein
MYRIQKMKKTTSDFGDPACACCFSRQCLLATGWMDSRATGTIQAADAGFKVQMEAQMSQLRDSLEQMQSRLKEEDWSDFDSASWNFS